MDEKEELIFPEIQDKSIPVKKRVLNSLVLFLEGVVGVILLYLAGMLICSLLSNWLGSCVCSGA